MKILELLFSASTFSSTFRLATPLVFGSVGGCFTKKVGTFFIAFESLMLISAFFAAWGSYTTGSAFLGMLFGIIASLITGIIFGVLVLVFKGDALIVSIALNYGAWAVTTQLLVSFFNKRGTFYSTDIINFRSLSLPLFSSTDTGALSTIFNNQIILVYLWPLFTILAAIVIYKTPYGLRMRGVGINEIASMSAGVNTNQYKWTTLLIMSVLLGIAGSYLPLCGVSSFTENMSGGRGNICLAAVLIGDGDPIVTCLIAVLFAYCSSLVLSLTSLSVPTQLLSCLPYAAVVFALFLNGIKHFRKSGDIS